MHALYRWLNFSFAMHSNELPTNYLQYTLKINSTVEKKTGFKFKINETLHYWFEFMMKTTNSVDIIDGEQPVKHPALIVSDTIRKCCLLLGWYFFFL